MKKMTCLFVFLMLCGIQICFAQMREITGTVIDKADKSPLPGVSVMVKGTATGMTTDINGKFALKVNENAVLVFSFMGMKTQDVIVKGQSNIKVEMDNDSKALDELIVVAYGTVKREALTGSAKAVSGEKLAKRQTSDITNALEGAVAGVQALSASGQPGEASTIVIRGIGSINASNTPLYVVDGVPYAGTTSGNLNAINPSDIESMTVLKDAAANSLYGSRAANGVIVITTKKGKTGKAIVSMDAKWGINSRGIKAYDMITDPGQYYEAAWMSLRNNLQNSGDGMTQAAASLLANQTLVAELGGYNNYNVANDQLIINGKLNPAAKLLYNDTWEDEAFSNNLRQEYQFAYQGGTEKTKYYMSLGYLDDKGYVDNSGFKRYNVRLNIDQELTSWFKAGANLSYANTTQNFPSSGNSAYANQFMFCQGIAPIYPVYLYEPGTGKKQYNSDGNAIYDYGTAKEFGYSRKYASNSNPIATQTLDIHDYKTDVFDGNTYMEVNFLKDFKFRANFAYFNSNRRDIDFQNAEYGDAANVGGRVYHYQYKRDVLTFNQLLSYSKVLGAHSIDVLLGHEAYKENYRYMEISKENFYYPGNPELDNAAKTTGAKSYLNSRRIESWFAKADYNYDNRYYASLSYRRDGSSRFSKDNRWGDFWSVGASWRVSQEKFMTGVEWIQNLKLKASYGTNGVESINNWYAWADQYAITSDGTNLGLNPSYYKGNSNLTWEKSKNFNVGLESDLFNWLTLDVEYFIRKSDDLLFNRPLPPSSGFVSYPENIGAMQNKGIELDLTFNIFKKTEFKWVLNVNATHYSNEITKLPSEFKETGILNGNKKYMEGHSIYDFYLERYLGVDPTNGKAMYYTDKENVANGTLADGTPFTYVSSNATQEFTGDCATPDLFGGMTNNFSYKGFDLSVMLNYQIGGTLYDGNYAGYMGNDLGSGYHKDVQKAWTPDNTNTNVPIMQQNYQDANSRSDRFLIDASYFSVKNIMLGYNFSAAVCKTLHLESLRVYAVGDNLALFSKRQGLDPRQYTYGATGYNFAPMRTISFGINVKF